MTYQITITSKGQITIPAALRRDLGLKKNTRLNIKKIPSKRTLIIEKAPDFFEVIKKIRVTKNKLMDPVKARAYMESHYERV